MTKEVLFSMRLSMADWICSSVRGFHPILEEMDTNS